MPIYTAVREKKNETFAWLRLRIDQAPVVAEYVRAAAAFAGGPAEIVVFEEQRAFVAASSLTTTVHKPRPRNAAEVALVQGNGAEGPMLVDGFVVAPIFGRQRSLVAALSVTTSKQIADLTGFQALARSVETVIFHAHEDTPTGFLERVFHGQRDATLVISEEFTVTWASSNIAAMLGLTVAETVGRSVLDFIHPNDVEQCLNAVIDLSEGREVYRITLSIRNSAGEYIPIEALGRDLTSDPVVKGIVLSVRNAEREGEFVNAMGRAQTISNTLVDSLRDAVVATNAYGEITTINQAARRLLNIDPLTPLEALERSSFPLTTLAGDPLNPFEPGPDGTDVDMIATHGEGNDLVYLNVRAKTLQDGEHVGLGRLVVLSDITRDYLAAQELERHANHDLLTGLGNRRKLETHLDHLASMSPPTNVAASCIDLDGLKFVNDSDGHRTGDQLIQVAAQRLSSQLGPNDTLIRQGGDEFVIVSTGVASMDDAVENAERFRSILDIPYTLGGKRFNVTGSIGVAIGQTDSLDRDQLLAHADLALYSAKNLGRNQVARFDETLEVSSASHDRRRHALHLVTRSDRLVMHYQPVVDAMSSATVGYEAFARIRGKGGELTTPGDFLDGFVTSPLMWELDSAAFVQTLQANRALREAHGDDTLRISSNFCGVSLTHPEFTDFIFSSIAEYGLHPTDITIEVSESATFDSGALGVRVLSELAAAGVRILLDDFGTGHTSLDLADLPIAGIKVDRSFISRLDRRHNRSIVEEMVGLAASLDLATVAQGVDTPAQLQQVRALGFDTIQGWAYAGALPLHDCLLIIEDSQRFAA